MATIDFKDLPDLFNEIVEIKIIFLTSEKMTFYILGSNDLGKIFTTKVPTGRYWDDIEVDQILFVGRNKRTNELDFIARIIPDEEEAPSPEIIEPVLKVNKTQVKTELAEVYAALNEKQKEAYNTIVQDRVNKIFFITGSPGTGKTFLARAIMLYYKSQSFSVEAIAPSHKAKKVLSDSLQIYATTVARFCGYTMEDTDNPVVNDEGEFVKTRDTQEVNIAIVDEISMVTDENFQEILDATKIAVIAMGDKNQLEAINADNADLSEAVTLELTEQMRQDNIDTALYRNIQMMKRKIQGSTEEIVYEFDDTFIKADNLIVNYMDNEIDIIVSYRNIFVDAYNNQIQKNYTGDTIPIEDDFLVLNKPMYSTMSTRSGGGKSYPILQNNGDLIQIRKIHKTQPEVGMIVELEVSEEPDATRLLLSREQWATKSFVFKLWESTWKRVMKWKDFKRFAINASLPYAVTCHKVQGSTYANVGINIADMNAAWKLNDKYRMIYVAMSRAKNKCYVKMP